MKKKHTNEKVGLNVIVVVVVSVALPALTVVALLRFSASFYSLLSALLNCKQHWLSHQYIPNTGAGLHWLTRADTNTCAH